MTEDSGDAPIEVAVGVLINEQHQFLLACRPPGKPMEGYWEFPGGKLEVGESVHDALARELEEELGIQIGPSYPWAQQVVTYAHATVRLHFRRCFRWTGTPRGLEGQEVRWDSIDNVTTSPWLSGALPLRRWLALPLLYALSNAGAMGCAPFLAALERACVDGLQMLQFREKTLDDQTLHALYASVRAVTKNAGVRLLINSDHRDAGFDDADGFHLTSGALAAATHRPASGWCGASVHTAEDLVKAGSLGLDFAMLGPVMQTATHPDAGNLGWPAFMALATRSAVPVYAIGGLDWSQLSVALEHGAHGIAALRGGLVPVPR